MGMDVVANENAMRWFCEYWAIEVQQNNVLYCAISNSTLVKDEL
jgi:hypothetical protein